MQQKAGTTTASGQVVNNRDRMSFELTVADATARLHYLRRGDRLILVHTAVPAAMKGQGAAGALVTAALDHAAERRLVVEPRCPFAAEWLGRHPEVAARATVEWPDDVAWSRAEESGR